MHRALLVTVLSLLALVPSPAQAPWPASWKQAAEPFHLVGNIYYVGSAGVAAYLLTSPQGHILLDGTLAENVLIVEGNIAKLGFRLTDVKILLNSHAHFDHAGALAQLKVDSGARLLASAGDKPILESGRLAYENSNHLPDFPPVRLDGVVKDGQVVRLGTIAMQAILTPGHTPGCTSWSTMVYDSGRPLRVIFPCSLTTGGNKLIANRGYPNIINDYRRSFARLLALKADVVLTAHPELSDVQGRAARRAGDAPDAFIDAGLLPRLVTDARKAFEQDLAREKGASR